MVERQHRVSFAAAEVCLELYDRVASRSGDALNASDKQPLEALGEKCPAKELLWVSILVRSFAQVDLPEVRGELRLLISPARHVGVWGDDFAPGLQRAGHRPFDQCAPNFALLPAHLLIVDQPSQLLLHLAHFICLGRRDCIKESRHGVKRAVGVVTGERLLMRPPVANVDKLEDEVAIGTA